MLPRTPTPALTEILGEGRPGCPHSHILYLNNGLDGQAYWCDETECGRHVRQPYTAETAGHIMALPPGARVSTPNPEFGGERAYAFVVDGNGSAQLLPRTEWTARSADRQP